MGIFSILVLLFCCVGSVFTLPNGAPSSACSSQSPRFSPRHADRTNGGFISSQSSSSLPYSIRMNSGNFSAGGLVQVWVMDNRPDNTGYRGILLQARNKMSMESGSVGTWQNAPLNTKMMTCMRENDAITHSEIMNIKSSSSIFTWRAPACLQNIDEIVFIATIAQSREMFWMDVMSSSLLRINSTGSEENSDPCGKASATTSNTIILLVHAAFAGIGIKVLLD